MTRKEGGTREDTENKERIRNYRIRNRDQQGQPGPRGKGTTREAETKLDGGDEKGIPSVCVCEGVCGCVGECVCECVWVWGRGGGRAGEAGGTKTVTQHRAGRTEPTGSVQAFLHAPPLTSSPHKLLPSLLTDRQSRTLPVAPWSTYVDAAGEPPSLAERGARLPAPREGRSAGLWCGAVWQTGTQGRACLSLMHHVPFR